MTSAAAYRDDRAAPGQEPAPAAAAQPFGPERRFGLGMNRAARRHPIRIDQLALTIAGDPKRITSPAQDKPRPDDVIKFPMAMPVQHVRDYLQQMLLELADLADGKIEDEELGKVAFDLRLIAAKLRLDAGCPAHGSQAQ